MARWAYRLSFVTALVTATAWASCGTLTDENRAWIFAAGWAVATGLWAIAFVLGHVARERLHAHPELSGRFRLREAREIQLLSLLAILGLSLPWFFGLMG